MLADLLQTGYRSRRLSDIGNADVQDSSIIFLADLLASFLGTHLTMKAEIIYFLPGITIVFPFIRPLYPTAATSSASQTLLIRLRIMAFVLSVFALLAKPVFTGPGQSAVTVIPVALNSSAKASEKDNT